jgi:tetratricopeptide (TPR) repeat protein
VGRSGKQIVPKGWLNLTRLLLLWVSLLLSLTGCTPAGPRNLLEGKKLIEKGRYPQAIERLTNAVALMPTNAQALNYLGLAYHYAGKPAEAEAAYHRALRLNQDLSEAHYNLGRLWLEQNKPDLARSELTAFTLRRGNSLDGFLKLGTALLASRDPAAPVAAEKAFQEALRLEAQNPEALNGLGMVRYHQRRYGEAQQFFLAAIKKSPDFAPAILNSAIVAHVRFQDYPAALQRYRQYLALTPAPPNTDAVVAITKEIEERLKPPAAQDHGTTGPQTTRAQNTQSVAAAIQASTNARFSYKPATKPAPGNRPEADRYFRQGREAQAAHKLADAVAAYRKATELDPTYFEALYNLGLTATEGSQLSLALSAYENALALTPDSADARYNFALLLQQGGYNVDAANELEKLLAKYPNDARAHLALANLSAQQLHDDARARLHYQKLLETDPRNPQANDIRRWIADHPQ